MSKRLMLILTCALIVGLALPVYADVQNIKVSGDILALGISRSFFEADVNKGDAEESHATSIIRLRVDADLTENVSAVLRVINERDWGTEADDATEIDLDLANITLREFLYSPLTLIIGRQELHFGNDLIVGDPDTNNQVSTSSGLADADLSLRKAFDAIRAILNYDPLVLDIIWAKIEENTIVGSNTARERDDIDLIGANARYDFGGNWNTLGELYWFRKIDQDSAPAASNKKDERIDNIGARLEITPLERLMLQGELAYQFGKNIENSVLKRHQAWAAQGVLRYALDTKYNPVLMAIYSYFSGDEENTDDQSRAWDPMFENQTNGHIANMIADQSDLHVIDLRGSMVPIEDLLLTLDFLWIEFAQSKAAGDTLTTRAPGSNEASHTLTGDTHLGNEVDLNLVYDYTDDVQLGLLAGWFIPGEAFDSGTVQTISEIIASVKVSF